MPDGLFAGAAAYESIDPGELRSAYERIVFYFAHNGRDDARDLAQETVKRHLEWLTREQIAITGSNGFLMSLFGVARRVLREDHRLYARGVRETSLQDAEILAARTPDPSETAAIRQALSKLSDDDRSLLERAESEGDDAVATDLGIPVKTLRVRLFRSRRKLRELYEGSRKPDRERSPNVLHVIGEPGVAADE